MTAKQIWHKIRFFKIKHVMYIHFTNNYCIHTVSCIFIYPGSINHNKVLDFVTLDNYKANSQSFQLHWSLDHYKTALDGISVSSVSLLYNYPCGDHNQVNVSWVHILPSLISTSLFCPSSCIWRGLNFTVSGYSCDLTYDTVFMLIW